MLFDGAAFGREIVASVKSYLERTLEPILGRLEALERDPAKMAVLVEETVDRVLGGWERPQNGIDGKGGADGRDGKDADPDLVASLVRSTTEAILAGWERPQDGKSVTVEELQPLITEATQQAFAAIPVPKDGRDGVGLAGAFQDKNGDLILTLADGRTVNIGRIDGRDGEKGQDGRDGADGFGFEDMTEELDADGRTIVRRYVRGDLVKEFRHTFAVVLDRGVWKDGTYQKGDAVTWDGQIYIAQAETAMRPLSLEAGGDWRLAVKSGRRGKDGVVRTINEKPIVKVA